MIKITFILLFLILLSCSQKPIKYTGNLMAMNTHIAITLFVKNEKIGKKIVNEIQTEAKRIENKFSAYIDSSSVSKINNRQNSNFAISDKETIALVKMGLEYGDKTNGIFDITVGPLKWLWGFGTGLVNKKPSQHSIDSVLKHIDYKKITISKDSIKFDDSEIKIDLGGISKGYALTKFENIVKKYGVKSFMINAGGDIICGNNKPDGKKWVIAIQHPRNNEKYIRIVKLSNSCVVTSGDYERFFVEENIRYHHLFDAKTGYPAKGIISATVLAKDPILADVFSTASFINHNGMNFEIEDLEEVILYNDTLKKIVKLSKIKK